MDGLYQQLLKPTMRAQQPQGEELQQVHKAANRHAAFVLQIRCGGEAYRGPSPTAAAMYACWRDLYCACVHAFSSKVYAP